MPACIAARSGQAKTVKKGRSLSGAGLQRYKQVACQKYIVSLKNRWLQCVQTEKRQSGWRKTARHNRNCLKMTILFVPNCHKVRICLTKLCALLCFAGEAGKAVLGKGRQWQLPALLALIPAFSQREKGQYRGQKSNAEATGLQRGNAEAQRHGCGCLVPNRAPAHCQRAPAAIESVARSAVPQGDRIQIC